MPSVMCRECFRRGYLSNILSNNLYRYLIIIVSPIVLMHERLKNVPSVKQQLAYSRIGATCNPL